jgi:predicted dehydrogenase
MSQSIALVGCGAIARAFYLPALAKHRAEFDRVWLVDPSEHALSMAASILPGKQARQLRDLDDEIRWVIVAAPNHLHFPIAEEALARGADVLIEKPFVIWPEEGRRLAEAAAANNRVIAINQTRRFFPLAGVLRRQIRAGEFGTLKSIVHREGTKLTWPFESGSGFARDAQRTGVIMDFGVHVIDFYHYLLHPEWTLISAVHDGFCGPEGLAEIELQANDAPVSIRLSRYHDQENVARLVFERAELSFNVYDGAEYSKRSNTGTMTRFTIPSGGAEYCSHAEPLLLNFLAASEKRESTVCDVKSSMPVIELLDEVYCRAERYPVSLGYV